MGYDVQRLRKQPSESRVYEMKFDAKMASADSITGVVSFTYTPTGTISVAAPSFAGKSVFARVSGGATGEKYKFTGVVSTSAGDQLEGEGYLELFDN